MNATSEVITFSPGLRSRDPLANYGLEQVTVRLRREICWRWFLTNGTTSHSTLPPTRDRLADTLDLSRYWEQKNQFYHTDPTAKYLTEKLTVDPPKNYPAVRGSLSWVVETLGLDEVSTFILALGLIVSFDNAASEVIAACLNDSTATQPSLALAQKLWERPEEVLAIATPIHPLWRYGLLQSLRESHSPLHVDWHSPFSVPPLIAHRLLFPDSPLPPILVPLSNGDRGQTNSIGDRAHLVAHRLRNSTHKMLKIVPIQGQKGSVSAGIVGEIAQFAQRKVVVLKGDRGEWENELYFKSLVTLCWLAGCDLLIPHERGGVKEGEKNRSLLSVQSIPIAIFLEVRDRQELNLLPSSLLLPLIEIPPLSYRDRVNVWQQTLGTINPTLNPKIAECSRRFRYETGTIQNICTGLQKQDYAISQTDLISACRAELELDISELAQPVTPRFTPEELVLPPKQQALFEDIYHAMKSLTEVHYEWGTAKAWNECGISVLFSGLPGTGKTMAAEILAARLELPMYRIDLSQVVNKYIGETEKNLKRLFDAADISDTLLFFDEADALFGRRTEVKDAHDRYANLEISYLLERMERFKGLAILATNRKKDLDEAFLRRLRYIIDFPLPDVRERHKIWQQSIPENVDASELDFEFLAKQFPLAGGNIRSIVFNACLQSAGRSKTKNLQLTMEQIIVCLKREYEKSNRSVSLEQFGNYAQFVKKINADY